MQMSFVRFYARSEQIQYSTDQRTGMPAALYRLLINERVVAIGHQPFTDVADVINMMAEQLSGMHQELVFQGRDMRLLFDGKLAELQNQVRALSELCRQATTLTPEEFRRAFEAAATLTKPTT